MSYVDSEAPCDSSPWRPSLPPCGSPRCTRPLGTYCLATGPKKSLHGACFEPGIVICDIQQHLKAKKCFETRGMPLPPTHVAHFISMWIQGTAATLGNTICSASWRWMMSASVFLSRSLS